MPTTAVLHIGMHKTGSTSIQFSLSGLDRDGYLYATLGNPNHSHAIMNIFRDEPEKYHTNVKRGISGDELKALRETQYERFRAELQKDRQCIIFSAEAMAALPAKAIKKMRAEIEQYYDQIKVYGYVRRPEEYVQSAIAQVIRGGFANLNGSEVRYRNRFKKFLNEYGSENVNLILYDRETFRDGSVVNDFCDRIGLPYSDPGERYNESLSSEVISLLYTFNREGMVTYGSQHMFKARGRMINYLNQNIPASKFKLPPEVIARWMDWEDIDWMQSTLGVTLSCLPDDVVSDGKARDTLDLPISGDTIERVKHLARELNLDVRPENSVVEVMNVMYTHFLERHPADAR